MEHVSGLAQWFQELLENWGLRNYLELVIGVLASVLVGLIIWLKRIERVIILARSARDVTRIILSRWKAADTPNGTDTTACPVEFCPRDVDPQQADSCASCCVCAGQQPVVINISGPTVIVVPTNGHDHPINASAPIEAELVEEGDEGAETQSLVQYE